jgi:RepB DNA-primase from phage plasmid
MDANLAKAVRLVASLKKDNLPRESVAGATQYSGQEVVAHIPTAVAHVYDGVALPTDEPAPPTDTVFQPSLKSEIHDEVATRYAQYSDYLKAIFKPKDVVCFVLIEHNKDGDDKKERVAQQFTTLEDALTKETFLNLVRANNEPSIIDRNSESSVYVAMNAYLPELVGKRVGRTQENVKELRALQSDMDDANRAAGVVSAMQSGQKVPAPSIVVESSTGKRQAIWAVNDFPKDDAKPVMQAIAKEYGTDSAVAEVARVMRVPGFVNRKYETSPVAKLLSNTGTRYTRSDFRVEVAPTTSFQSASPDEYLNAPFIRKGGQYGGIYSHVLKIVGHYVSKIKDGGVMFDIVNGCKERNGCFLSDGVTPYEWNEDQVRQQCHKLVEEWKNKGGALELVHNQQPAQQAPPAQPMPNYLVGATREFDPWEYALKPLMGQPFSGWFPLGRVTLASGSSGAMKTTFLAQALVSGRDGENFLGHEAGKLPFKFLFADRGKYDCEETFQRMNLVGKVPFEPINEVSRFEAAQAIADAASCGEYKILVVDGGDLLVEENNKGEKVQDLNKVIQAIARHYGVGIVVTTGAGKMSAQALKQGAERRSITKGSEVWGRMGGSVFTLNSEHDGTQDTRRLVVQHRNAASERFLLEVKGGRLVPMDERKVEEQNEARGVMDWVRGRERFTMTDIMSAFRWSGTTAIEWITTLTKRGDIRRCRNKGANGRVWYKVPSTTRVLEEADGDYQRAVEESTVDLNEADVEGRPAAVTE